MKILIYFYQEGNMRKRKPEMYFLYATLLYAVNVIMTSLKIQVLCDVAVCL